MGEVMCGRWWISILGLWSIVTPLWTFLLFTSPCAESIEITVLVIYNCRVQPMIDDGHYNIWGICIDRWMRSMACLWDSQSVCGPSNVSVLALQSNHQMRALARWNSRAFHYFTDPAVIVIITTHQAKFPLLPHDISPGHDLTVTHAEQEREGNPSVGTWLTWNGKSIVLWRPSWRWDIHFLAKPCAATIILLTILFEIKGVGTRSDPGIRYYLSHHCAHLPSLLTLILNPGGKRDLPYLKASLTLPPPVRPKLLDSL